MALNVKALTKSGKIGAYRADPGLRALLPDSALTSVQRAQRALNRSLDAPASAGSSLTRRDLAHIVNSAATQRYGTQQSLLGSQAQAIPAYYQAYRNEIAGTQGQYDTTNPNSFASQRIAALQGIGASGTTAGAGMTGPAVAGLGQAAQVQGGTVDPQIAQVLANAATVRTVGANGMTQLAANQANSQADFLKNLGLLTYQQQAGAQNANTAARQGLADQVGAYKDTERESILAADQKNQIAQALTGSTISSRQAAATTAAKNAATARRRADIAQENADTTAKRAAQPKAKKRPTAGPGALTTQGENRYTGQIAEAQHWFRIYGQAGADPSAVATNLIAGATVKDAKGNKTNLPKIDPRLVHAAQHLTELGGLTPDDVKALEHMGIHAGHYKILTPAQVKERQTVNKGTAFVQGAIGGL